MIASVSHDSFELSWDFAKPPPGWGPAKEVDITLTRERDSVLTRTGKSVGVFGKLKRQVTSHCKIESARGKWAY